MKSLECRNENWYVSDEESKKWITKMTLPDFRGDLKECWHLRGRGWRWLILRSDFTDLKEKEYFLTFWGKHDYYSGNGTRCFVNVYEKWEERVMYDIKPNSPYAMANAGDWYLYKIPVKLIHGNNLKVELTSSEANIAILQADPGDENDPSVVKLQQKDEIKPYYINEELPFSEFTYLEQRMVKYYSDLLAPYNPTKEIPEAGQYEYYDFVKGLYNKLFNKPEDFFTKLNPDDAYPNRFNNNEYGKPELKRNMKKARDKIEELFGLLLTIGSTGEAVEEGLLIRISLNKKQKAMLSFMELDITDGILKHKKYPNLGHILKYLAGKEQPFWVLKLCWFDSDYPYSEKTHEKFYDRGQYQRLINWLKDKGYRSSINYNYYLALDYTKSISKNEKPVGYALFGDKYHYGFTFEYRSEPRVMQHCELRIIQFAKMLKSLDELSERTKNLILLRTKVCDGCRYCVQTDKTGKRPLAAISVTDGTNRCPYYPGFAFVYERLTKDDVDDIIAFLTDLEQVIINK